MHHSSAPSALAYTFLCRWLFRYLSLGSSRQLAQLLHLQVVFSWSTGLCFTTIQNTHMFVDAPYLCVHCTQVHFPSQFYSEWKVYLLTRRRHYMPLSISTCFSWFIIYPCVLLLWDADRSTTLRTANKFSAYGPPVLLQKYSVPAVPIFSPVKTFPLHRFVCYFRNSMILITRGNIPPWICTQMGLSISPFILHSYICFSPLPYQLNGSTLV